MKKKSTTIILIVIIIGLIGSGCAFYMMKNSPPIDDQSTNPSISSTTQEQTTQEKLSEVQSPSNIITEPPEKGTQGKDYIGTTGEISLNEVFQKLDEYYGKGYDINVLDYSVQPPKFKVVDISTGEVYSYVVVDLNTAIATETIQSTKETKEFSLFG